MSFRFNLAFGGIVAAQLLLLGGLIGIKEYNLHTGTTVVLQAAPVDPRSLLQGDYAILGYEISGLPSDLSSSFPIGSPVYVVLEQRGDVWAARKYLSARPPEGDLYIQGEIGNARQIDFGIDTYFVPEGTGHIIERARDVKVEVAVSSSGKATIRDVIVDGKPFKQGLSER